MQETITRFPGRKAVTAVLISSTTPTPSTLLAAIPFGFYAAAFACGLRWMMIVGTEHSNDHGGRLRRLEESDN